MVPAHTVVVMSIEDHRRPLGSLRAPNRAFERPAVGVEDVQRDEDDQQEPKPSRNNVAMPRPKRNIGSLGPAFSRAT
jgi:hypothetical protein